MRVSPLVVVASPVDAWRRLYRVRGVTRPAARREEFFGWVVGNDGSIAVARPWRTMAPPAAFVGGRTVVETPRLGDRRWRPIARTSRFGVYGRFLWSACWS